MNYSTTVPMNIKQFRKLFGLKERPKLPEFQYVPLPPFPGGGSASWYTQQRINQEVKQKEKQKERDEKINNILQ